jgi:aryl sulfotransferase
VDEQLQLQTHRRFVKTHLPSIALPLCSSARYIYVARDARDQIWSAYNHFKNLDSSALLVTGKPHHEFGDVREYYHRQLDRSDDDPWPYWAHLLSWWNLRRATNVLLVHYANLKADLVSEIARIASFLQIDVPDHVVPRIIDHTQFDYMKLNADRIVGPTAAALKGGARTILNLGINGRWRQTLTSGEIRKCDDVAARYLPRECASWMATGKLDF